MANHFIFLCIFSLALVSSIFGIPQGLTPDVSEQNGNAIDSDKDKTIRTLQRLLTALNSKSVSDSLKITEFEKENSEYKERLHEYENTDCLPGHNSSKIYIVHVPGIESFPAPCESHLENGGWTVIQRRLDGTVSFEQGWEAYRNGFGDLNGEFFIGLEKLHKMTIAEPQELLVYYETMSYSTDNLKSEKFLIGSEEEEYVLKSARSNSYSYFSLESSIGKKFTTFDRDNDNYWWGNCAKEFKGGWWFGDCKEKLRKYNEYNSIVQKFSFSYNGDSILKSMQMMIRPKRLSPQELN